jgi:hypothetical protein
VDSPLAYFEIVLVVPVPDTPTFDQHPRDNPDVNRAGSSFGKVARKRVDGNGRKIQIGIRFMF